MRRHLWWAPGLLVLLGIWLARLPGHQAMQSAEAAGDQGAWDAAARALEQLPRTGPARWSTNALYSRGVIAWEQGEAEAALAAWHAAAHASPRDQAIQRALRDARRGFDSRPAPLPLTPSWTQAITPGELGLLVLLTWGLVSWLAWRGRQRQVPTFAPWTVAAIALVLSGIAWHGHRTASAPVLVSLPDTPGRLLPEPTADPIVRWPAGTELRWRDHRGRFVRVEDGAGTTAWVVAEAVAWPPDAKPPGR